MLGDGVIAIGEEGVGAIKAFVGVPVVEGEFGGVGGVFFFDGDVNGPSKGVLVGAGEGSVVEEDLFDGGGEGDVGGFGFLAGFA